MIPDDEAPPGVVTGAVCRACGNWRSVASPCPRCLLLLALETPAGPEPGDEAEPEDLLAAPPWVPAPVDLAHFALERERDGAPVELGRGAMGVTYLATDQSLHIKVALKAITPERVGDHSSLALFLREARAAAKVRHSKVASVLYLSERPGSVFYAMEFVPGEPLRRWIERHAPVPPPLALALAEQIASGLGAIHAEGLVHRDLKPGNVMLLPAPRSSTGGPPDVLSSDAWHAKIIDFGLARAIVKDDKGDRTVGFRGTALYASPEQCEQRHDLDGRSDLYSLGCTLFELLTGKPPFQARTHSEVLRLHVAQAPPVDRLAHVPTIVADITARLLAKDPAARFLDAESAARALRRVREQLEFGDAPLGWAISPAPPPPQAATKPRHRARSWLAVFGGLLALLTTTWLFLRPSRSEAPPAPGSVAVLPFSNFSPDPQNAFLADGLQEGVITSLAKLGELRVTAPASVRDFRPEAARDLASIGVKLRVGALVEASVRREAGRIRVNAKIVQPATGQMLWANVFENEASDLFALQGKVATEIANALRGSLTDEERALLAPAAPRAGESYALYMRARTILGRGRMGRAEMDEVARILEEAIRHDPDFAPAHAQLSILHTIYYSFGRDRTDQRLGLAHQAAEAARRLAPEAPETLLAFGEYYYRGYRDYGRALPYLRRALELAPGNAEALTTLGLMERRQGRWEDALAKLRRVGEVDPLNPRLHYNITTTLWYLRRYEEAAAHVEAAIQRNGSQFILGDVRGDLYIAWKGRTAEAWEAANSRAPRAVSPEIALVTSVRLLCLDRRFTEAEQELERSTFSRLDGQLVYFTRESLAAEISTQAGRSPEAAMRWAKALGEAEEMASARPTDPRLRSLHAIALAGCGRAGEALAEARAAVELSSLARDAFEGTYFLERLALVQLRCGRGEEAAATIRQVLAVPGRLSLDSLRISPEWRGLPLPELASAPSVPSASKP